MIKSIFLTLLLMTNAVAAPLNHYQQISSHNSYDKDYDIIEQLSEHKIHSLELDIYRGKFFKKKLYDWYVYHFPIIDTRTSCQTLSKCLKKINLFHKANPKHNLITIWIDIKNKFNQKHSGLLLNKVLTSELDNFFTPEDMKNYCKGSKSVQIAAKKCGWPDLQELRGKIMVILTGKSIWTYHKSQHSKYAFIAPRIESISELDEKKYDDVAVINLKKDHWDLSPELFELNLLSRVYVLLKKHFKKAHELMINHVAIDNFHKVNQKREAFKCLTNKCKDKKE